ncbi:unnamed protein product [Urochloa humidicola]
MFLSWWQNYLPSQSGRPNSSARHSSQNNSADKSKLKRPHVRDENSDDSKMGTTFEPNGVIFPPPYKPHGKITYNGQRADLKPEQEEVANHESSCLLLCIYPLRDPLQAFKICPS